LQQRSLTEVQRLRNLEIDEKIKEVQLKRLELKLQNELVRQSKRGADRVTKVIHPLLQGFFLCTVYYCIQIPMKMHAVCQQEGIFVRGQRLYSESDDEKDNENDD
jgi:hypothetical protein